MLEDTIFVLLRQHFVGFLGGLRVLDDHLVEDEFSQHILIDGVLLELKVKVADGLGEVHVAVLLWIVELRQEWVSQEIHGR